MSHDRLGDLRMDAIGSQPASGGMPEGMEIPESPGVIDVGNPGILQIRLDHLRGPVGQLLVSPAKCLRRRQSAGEEDPQLSRCLRP
jgi:hypothetical protein